MTTPILRKFQLTNVGGNNNKWWQVQATPHADGTTYTVVYTFARVGQTCGKPTNTVATLPQIERKIAEKERKGYREIDLHQPPTTTTALARTSSTAAAHPDSKVTALVQWLWGTAAQAIDTFLEGRVDALSQAQIQQGRQALTAIAHQWRSYQQHPTARALDAACDAVEAFHNIVPRRIPFMNRASRDERRRTVTETFCTDLSVIETELDQLEAALATLTVDVAAPSGPAQRMHLTALGVELAVLPDADGRAAQLRAWLERRHNHDYRLHVRDIFMLHAPALAARYDASLHGKQQVVTVTHGSRVGNWRHILSQGLRLPRYTGVANGSMFGRGLYFATQSTKSGNYCADGGWRSWGTAAQYGLLLCDVAVGRSYMPSGSNSALGLDHPAMRGYDSVWAKGGRSGVANDEIVVFREEQVLPRFFVTWERRPLY